jgi:hypothetical protein
MLEKLATHNIQDVTKLFSLADKCGKAVEGHAWHAPPTLEAGKECKPDTGTASQGSSNNNKNKNKKKKASSNNQSLAGAPTAVAGGSRGPRGNKRPRQASGGDDGGA